MGGGSKFVFWENPKKHEQYIYLQPFSFLHSYPGNVLQLALKFILTNLDEGFNPEDASESDEEVDNPDVVDSDVFGTPVNLMEAPWLSYMTGAHPISKIFFCVQDSR